MGLVKGIYGGRKCRAKAVRYEQGYMSDFSHLLHRVRFCQLQVTEKQ